MIALIDYGAGNTASVANVLTELRADYVITNREEDICKAEKIIFPGVGQASFAIKKLNLFNLINALRIIKKPFLGICLGMQLMCDESEEGDVKCLGIFPGKCKLFTAPGIKVPHMGWNRVEITKESKLFDGIKSGEYYYFAHSYFVPENENTVAVCSHGSNFSAVMEKENYYGVQFHPEKSGHIGIKIVQNFIELC